MTDKELLESIKAREELEKRGYKRKLCSLCKGVPTLGSPCGACGGKGYKWEAPLMRML